ncbi:MULTISPECIES: DUF6879 family protein [unclassified Streptomyces]|uniref:DUF6879 family protein n=1 Tax=unclassified Streptomyces TaxID=2593676 RepID=UPI000DAE023C|nr:MULTISPECIES: DUF6879 family protein [unclassified Streptomyces]PZT72117.1 hypothetical protein DNK55_26415 [Streptomyces sp. AC1-42T]PZT81560.1 hypothetical protein DNK56_05160 [Streptomyces sp. AC1-42W]
MNISPDEFGKLFTEFQREAFRLETLDDYSKSGGVDAYHVFLAGRPQPEEYKSAGWVTTVRDATQAGKRMYRVHILARPLSDYLRFELGWGYLRNQEAGEEFFILDTTEQPNPLEGVPDFWAFDESSVVTMQYGDGGEFLGAELIPEEQAGEWLERRDAALSNAVPFRDWWEQHKPA